ncbi:MAG: ABC transporter ATP-binding protein [Acidobacteriota bacterium]
MIELSGITRTFEVGARPVHALRDVGMRVPDGDYLSVMGPSGSGKSTMLNLLGCLDRATSGTYMLDGQDVTAMDDAALTLIRRNRIGFVFQTFHLVPRLTAQGNVELPMMFAGIDRREREARARELLGAVGLSDRADHRPEQLSGGERQRVAIARAVVMRPSVLLADEPTGNLDSASGAEVVALLERMNAGGITLIVVTHDAVLGGRARHRVRMADGRIVEETGAPR